MLAKSQTTPTVPALSPETNRNGHTPRRAASSKQRSTVRTGSKPFVTRAAYNKLTQGASDTGAPPEPVDVAKKRLCAARAAVGNALLMIDAAMHSHRPGLAGTPAEIDARAHTWQALRSVRRDVERGWVAFPLEVGE
jgi:hypothetical protein